MIRDSTRRVMCRHTPDSIRGRDELSGAQCVGETVRLPVENGIPAPRVLVSEGNIEPSSQDNVILLERRRGRRRIGHIDIAKRILPPQPLAQFGHAAEIEGPTIFAGVTEVGEEVQLLSDKSRCAQLMTELLSKCQGREIAAQSRVVLFRVVQTAKEIQCGAVAFYSVKPETAAQHGSKIQVLQGIRLEVRAPVGKQQGTDIPGITSAALIRTCGRVRYRSRRVIGGVHRVGIKRDVVSQCLAIGSEGHGQALGLTISASEGKSHVRSSRPTLQKSGMERVLIRYLLRVAAQRSHIALRHVYGSVRRGRYRQIAVCRGNRTNHSFSVRQHYMERLCGTDFLDSQPLNGNLARKLRFNQQVLIV